MFRLRTVSIFLAGLLMYSCSNESSETNPDAGYAYFPLVPGKQLTYVVDSLAYDNNTGTTTIDTFLYYYREITGPVFSDDQGSVSYEILRYSTDSLNHAWSPLNRWTAHRNNFRAERVEDNRRFVKLVFPLDISKSWDGNMYNNLGFERYAVKQIAEPFPPFSESLLIEQRNDSNAIEWIYRSERYVRNLGLVERVSDSVNTQIKGSRGYRVRYTLIDAK